MSLSSFLVGLIFIVNMLLAIIVVFLERKDAGATWAWILVLFFIPGLGFFMYLIFGRTLNSSKMFQWEDQKKMGIAQLISNQLMEICTGKFPYRNDIEKKYHDLIFMHLSNNDAVLTQDNQVEIFTDGKDKFDALFQDIDNAKDHIHLQYYILKRDGLGKKLLAALVKKAKEGVKVRLLYDDLGSRSMTRGFFKELRNAGGDVEAFFPSKLHIINFRINYRNHRKLAIIDGKIGYVGGFNIGDEYLGKNPKFGYWRDTHLRIEGSAVYAIQTRFILDWNQASDRHDIHYAPELFPRKEMPGDVGIQIVTSGPDSEWEQIKNGYIKMITSAKKSVWIQTPYFIPDASLLDALRIAALSGVDIRIMIPNKPDHPFVYWATYSYIGEMLKTGAKVYIYDNGFIHAKTLIVDHEISSVGTANIDVRSFRLNFEVNAFIYDEQIAHLLSKSFLKDMEVSWELTNEIYQNRPLKIRFKESISRLLSPIL